ncbi:MAG: cyclase family protein [Acidimicrobiales bacterium]
MRSDHLNFHLSRRDMLSGMAKLGAAGAIVAGGGGALATAAGAGTGHGHGDNPEMPNGSTLVRTDYDDSFSIEGALNGEWAKATQARYGKDDQLGSLNEITPRKTAQAIKLLEGGKEVVTYRMGHLMVNGMPGFNTFPPRKYSQRLIALGYTPNAVTTEWFSTDTRGNEGEDEWRRADRASTGGLGYFQGPTGFGTNNLSAHEERLLEGGTYQIATQLDNLSHVGVGHIFYNGYDAREFAKPTGATKLGMEHVPPFVTRGVIIDILDLKMSQGATGDIQTVNGNKMLTDSYRITLEDIQAAMKRTRVGKIRAGDVVCFRTGWHHLGDDPATYDKYLATEPGIYLREARWLVDHRPAVVAADTWALEVLPGVPTSDPGQLFTVHQELIVKNGIRIGEAVIVKDLAEDGVHEFVYSYSPQYAKGATAGNVPPIGMAVKKSKGRR